MTPARARLLLKGEPLYEPTDPLVGVHVWKMIYGTFKSSPPIEIVHMPCGRIHLGDGRYRLAAVLYYGKDVDLDEIHRTPK